MSAIIHLPFFNHSHPALAPQVKLPSTRRMAGIFIGFLYPFAILVAIVVTANHFVLDAVAGTIVCYLGLERERNSAQPPFPGILRPVVFKDP